MHVRCRPRWWSHMYSRSRIVFNTGPGAPVYMIQQEYPTADQLQGESGSSSHHVLNLSPERFDSFYIHTVVYCI